MSQVLSINSSLAFGHVGHEAAAFALRRLGHEVWCLPTVQFSNHPGHGGYRGGPVPPARLANLLRGMAERHLLDHCAALHSGYLGHADVADIVLAARRQVPKGALYCCDPVMGDDGKAYVADDIIEGLRQRLVPVADIVTPNRFELGLLTGLPVANLGEAVAAARALLSLGPSLVVCTSAAVEDGEILSFALTAAGGWLVRAPRVDKPPHGIGDAFTAIFLGRYLERPDPARALALATASIAGLLAWPSETIAGELAIVPGQAEIAAPSVEIEVETLAP